MSTGTAQEPRTTELAKAYEHRDVEARWYPFWKDRGYFHGDENDTSRPATGRARAAMAFNPQET